MPSKFKKLWDEYASGQINYETFLDSNFTLILTDSETWNDFKYCPEPPMPVGYKEAHLEYEKEKDNDEKSKLWKGIEEQFKGYLKLKRECVEKNNSDLNFLNEMKNYFESKSMMSYATKVKEKILTYFQN